MSSAAQLHVGVRRTQWLFGNPYTCLKFWLFIYKPERMHEEVEAEGKSPLREKCWLILRHLRSSSAAFFFILILQRP